MPRDPFIPPPDPAIRISGSNEMPGANNPPEIDINIQLPDEYSWMPLPGRNNDGDNEGRPPFRRMPDFGQGFRPRDDLFPPGDNAEEDDGNGFRFPNFPDLGQGFRPRDDLFPPGYAQTNERGTDKKRRITVSRNSLDPISDFYFSKVKYGNHNNLRLTSPSADPSLKILTRDAIVQPNFQWSIAPIEGIQTPPLQTTSNSLILFLKGIDPTPLMRGEHYKNLYRQYNPYVYVNKAIEGSVPTYGSMPAKMLDAVLSTAERIVGLFSLMSVNGNPIPFHEDMKTMAVRLVDEANPPRLMAVEDPEVHFFFTELIVRGSTLPFHEGNFAQEIEDYRREVKLRVVAGRGDITMLTICNEILMRIATDPISREKEKQLNRYLVVDSLRPVCNTYVLMSALKDNNAYDYRQRYIEIDTPYITTKKTHRFLSDVREPFYISKITSDYNFYARDYEELHGNVSILALPNTYVRQSYLDLYRLGNLDPASQERLDEYESLITVNGSYNSQGRQPGQIFYNQYAKAVALSEDIDTIEEKQRSIIFESSKVRNTTAFSNRPPFALNLQYYREGSPELNNILNNIEMTGFASTMFENISRVVPRGMASRYSTEYLATGGLSLTEVESDFFVTALREYSIPSILTPVPQNTSLVVGETPLNNPDSLGILGDAIQWSAQEDARRSPSNILNALDSTNFSLGHRLAKLHNGTLMQDFYLENGATSRDSIYVDSQINYGEEYTYELYEYRLVYGTKYKFNAFAAENVGIRSTMPMWVLQYHLGLRRRLTQQQVLVDRPNIYFSGYMEPTSEYSVVEVPIYSPDYVPSYSQSTSRRSNPLELEPLNGLPRDLNLSALRREPLAESIVYPPGKVMDYPPTPPILSVYPLVGNSSQLKMCANLQTGELTGDNAMEIVSIGDNEEQFNLLKQYQDNYVNWGLPPRHLEFRNEGLAEIRNILLYRTQNINLQVETYNEIYSSFDPRTNPSVLVRSYSDKGLSGDIPSETVSSYDILENISSNINYYYTCVVEDMHGNVSNPSIIYRVRLLADNGLIIPEVDTVLPLGLKPQTPSKNLTQHISIKASDIQSLPVVISDNDVAIQELSLGKHLGKSIEGQSYIVRLTSKDTGRKFDIKLNFVVRINGQPINVGT